jgi:hypothetical protein
MNADQWDNFNDLCAKLVFAIALAAAAAVLLAGGIFAWVYLIRYLVAAHTDRRRDGPAVALRCLRPRASHGADPAVKSGQARNPHVAGVGRGAGQKTACAPRKTAAGRARDRPALRTTRAASSRQRGCIAAGDELSLAHVRRAALDVLRGDVRRGVQLLPYTPRAGLYGRHGERRAAEDDHGQPRSERPDGAASGRVRAGGQQVGRVRCRR